MENLRQILADQGGLSASVVHIAGSKGKGTTAWLMAAGLQAAGKKVGLFTSPFLLEPREMIRVNGEMIEEARFAEYVSAYEGISEFETWTLAALKYFEEEGCDFVVLECGWGGRDDATNIVENKVLTVLTHIELEHTEVLGDSLGEIAARKLGICRPGVPLLTVNSQPVDVMLEARSAGVDLFFAPSMDLGWQHPESVGLAIMGLDVLGFPVDFEALKQVEIPGRFQVRELGKHVLILDGAHTYDSIRFVQERALRYAHENNLDEPLYAIHTLKDKPTDLWTLFPSHRTVWIEIEHERASEGPDSLARNSVEGFLRNLRGEEPRLVVVTGSFRTVAGFLKEV